VFDLFHAMPSRDNLLTAVALSKSVRDLSEQRTKQSRCVCSFRISCEEKTQLLQTSPRSASRTKKTTNLRRERKMSLLWILLKTFVWRSKNKAFRQTSVQTLTSLIYISEMDPEAIAVDNSRHSFGRTEVLSSIAIPAVRSNELSVDAWPTFFFIVWASSIYFM